MPASKGRRACRRWRLRPRRALPLLRRRSADPAARRALARGRSRPECAGRRDVGYRHRARLQRAHDRAMRRGSPWRHHRRNVPARNPLDLRKPGADTALHADHERPPECAQFFPGKACRNAAAPCAPPGNPLRTGTQLQGVARGTARSAGHPVDGARSRVRPQLAGNRACRVAHGGRGPRPQAR